MSSNTGVMIYFLRGRIVFANDPTHVTETATESTKNGCATTQPKTVSSAKNHSDLAIDTAIFSQPKTTVYG